MWSLHGSAASASSSWPTIRRRLESTLYHRQLLPPRFDRLPFHTAQPVTGQRGTVSLIVAINDNHRPLVQLISSSTSNSYVQALSVFMRILPSLPAATQQNTYTDVWWSEMRM